MGKAKKRRSVDTGPEGRENEPLRRPRPYLSRTQADVERELDVALTKAFMGMVESWELMIAPEAVQGAFVRAVYTLWAEGKRARPALRREELPGADLLLQHRLAVEKDGWVEIPCVTEGWEAFETYRTQARARQAKHRRIEPTKGANKRLSRVSHALVTRDSNALHTPSPENTEVSLETSNGTPPALRARKNLDLKILLPEEEESESKETTPWVVARKRKGSPEGKGKPTERSTRCPKSWQPNLDHVALAENLHVVLIEQVEQFRDFEFKRPYGDWDATFRNWLRRAAEMPRKGGASATRRNMSATEALEEYVRRRERGEPLFPDITATRTR